MSDEFLKELNGSLRFSACPFNEDKWSVVATPSIREWKSYILMNRNNILNEVRNDYLVISCFEH